MAALSPTKRRGDKKFWKGERERETFLKRFPSRIAFILLALRVVEGFGDHHFGQGVARAVLGQT